ATACTTRTSATALGATPACRAAVCARRCGASASTNRSGRGCESLHLAQNLLRTQRRDMNFDLPPELLQPASRPDPRQELPLEAPDAQEPPPPPPDEPGPPPDPFLRRS